MLRNPAFWVVLFLVIVLLFGANKLPGLAGSVGKSLKIFKKEVNELQDDGTGNDSGTSANATIDYNQSTVTPQPTPHTAEPQEQHSSEPPK